MAGVVALHADQRGPGEIRLRATAIGVLPGHAYAHVVLAQLHVAAVADAARLLRASHDAVIAERLPGIGADRPVLDLDLLAVVLVLALGRGIPQPELDVHLQAQRVSGAGAFHPRAGHVLGTAAGIEQLRAFNHIRVAVQRNRFVGHLREAAKPGAHAFVAGQRRITVLQGLHPANVDARAEGQADVLLIALEPGIGAADQVRSEARGTEQQAQRFIGAHTVARRCQGIRRVGDTATATCTGRLRAQHLVDQHAAGNIDRRRQRGAVGGAEPRNGACAPRGTGHQRADAEGEIGQRDHRHQRNHRLAHHAAHFDQLAMARSRVHPLLARHLQPVNADLPCAAIEPVYMAHEECVQAFTRAQFDRHVALAIQQHRVRGDDEAAVDRRLWCQFHA